MIIVRNVFIAKPGKASTLAAQFKKAADDAIAPPHRILTDVTGDFNRVVLEYEVESISAFEAQMKEYQTDEKMRSAMKGYEELFISGYRELLKTV